MEDKMTQEELLEALRASAKAAKSDDEIRKQRVSFVYGSLDEDSHIEREEVEQALTRETVQVL